MAKGGSSTQTSTQNTLQTQNNQVATTSGLAIGSGANANISIQNTDAEVVKAAAEGNTAVSENALASNYAVTRDALKAGSESSLAAAGVAQTATVANSAVAGAALQSNEDVTKTAIENSSNLAGQTLASNNTVTQDAFNFGSNALGVTQAIGAKALDETNATAQLAISGGNDLASKYAAHLENSQAQDIALLQNLANENTNVTLENQKTTNAALDRSFGLAANAAPQSDAATVQNLTATSYKYLVYVAIAIAVGFIALGFGLRRK